MNLSNRLAGVIKRNSTTILSSTAIVGVGTTAYLSAVAAIDITKELEGDYVTFDRKTLFKRYWKRYIPAVASGVVTSACIIGVAKVGNKRAMAAQAAFVLTERAYSEYRDKVIEEFGEKKDEKIRELVAQDKVRNNPPSNEVVIVPAGQVLCCELYTGRYFQSDMETLRKAQNDLNARLISQDNASLEEWYYLIGLQPTSFSSDYGWNSDKMLELEFSTVLTEDGRPCLAFSYKHIRLLYEGLME